MRYRYPPSWITLLAAGFLCIAEISTPIARALSSDQIDQIFRQYRVAVRVYKDPVADPAVYQLIYVQADGPRINLDAIKKIVPDISDRSFIVIMDTDQAYSQLKQALKGILATSLYVPNAQLSLCVNTTGVQQDPWVFQDALGQPISGATVQVGMNTPHRPPSATILLGQMNTDDQGRLARWGICQVRRPFVFTISHARYGKARVEVYSDAKSLLKLPLAPKDHGQVPGLLRGRVLDPNDRPVSGVEVYVWVKELGNEVSILTDAEGTFACIPVDQVQSTRPIGLGLRCIPPTSSGLAGRYVDVPPGVKDVVVRLEKPQDETMLRRFRFEDFSGPIEDQQELSRITIICAKPNSVSREFVYEQFKDGLELGQTIAEAYTTRWGRRYSFQHTVLSASGPSEVVFKPMTPRVYLGKVVRNDNYQPVGRAYVLVSHPLAKKDPSELTTEDWQLLGDQAQRELDPSVELLHQPDGRVVQADENGSFCIRFMPGLSSNLLELVAVAPGYGRGEPISSNVLHGGTVTEHHVEIALKATEQVICPTFVFEDGSGPIQDEQMLEEIWISIRRGRDIPDMETISYKDLQSRPFRPGIYSANVTWKGKYYEFGSIDLRGYLPGEVIVFRPTSILELGLPVTYTGRVIDGATGMASRGAIVYSAVADETRLHPILLTPEQWQAIHRLGPNLDQDDPALWPIKAAVPVETLTVTDSDGRFELTVPILQPQTSRRMLAIQQDYMPTQIGLPRDAQPGHVVLRTVGLFPAGKVRLKVLWPEQARLQRGADHICVVWYPEPYQAVPWVDGLIHWTGSVQRMVLVQAGRDHQLFVPAGVEISLRVDARGEMDCGPAFIGPFKVEKGQILDLGVCRLPRSRPVRILVTDILGRPVPGVTVSYRDQADMRVSPDGISDYQGRATLMLCPYLRGNLWVGYRDGSSGRFVTESKPLDLSGPEDLNREIAIIVSDQFVKGLRSQGK